MTILVIAEHNNAELNAATLNTVAAAQAIGGEIAPKRKPTVNFPAASRRFKMMPTVEARVP